MLWIGVTSRRQDRLYVVDGALCTASPVTKVKEYNIFGMVRVMELAIAVCMRGYSNSQ